MYFGWDETLSDIFARLPTVWDDFSVKADSFISMNWRAKPLISHRTIINLIGPTTTRTGLRVNAQLSAVKLESDPFHPEWNYTIEPRTR